jgi:hypothetical protein
MAASRLKYGNINRAVYALCDAIFTAMCFIARRNYILKMQSKRHLKNEILDCLKANLVY